MSSAFVTVGKALCIFPFVMACFVQTYLKSVSGCIVHVYCVGVVYILSRTLEEGCVNPLCGKGLCESILDLVYVLFGVA